MKRLAVALIFEAMLFAGSAEAQAKILNPRCKYGPEVDFLCHARGVKEDCYDFRLVSCHVKVSIKPDRHIRFRVPANLNRASQLQIRERYRNTVAVSPQCTTDDDLVIRADNLTHEAVVAKFSVTDASFVGGSEVPFCPDDGEVPPPAEPASRT